jgi:signal transduction histidine kinase/ActR/RegA family two-component response regulator
VPEPDQSFTAQASLADAVEAREPEADRLLRNVIEACPANLLISRAADGEILCRSSAATELLGAVGRHAEPFAEPAAHAGFLAALLPHGRVDAMPAVLLRPDRTAFAAAISARVVDDRGGAVIVSTVTDLGREAALQAETADRRATSVRNGEIPALGELLAGVAHALSNPLSVVVGQALMLREDVGDPAIVRRIDKIAAAAERCARLVKSALALARPQPASLAPADLDAIVATGVDAVRNGPSGLSATVELALAGDLPRIAADADQIARVVADLVSNADQAIAGAGRGGRIRVSTHHDAAAASGELRVADDGPGIPEPARGRVFEPLFTTGEAGKGAGIGLALCHRIVSAHRGTIRAEPNPDGGATFVVRLPVTAAAAQPAITGLPASSRRARILVVDDEPEVADLIREVLEREGFEVEHAGSAEAALEKTAAAPYALILSDLAMPGLGGRGLWEAIGRDRPALLGRIAFVTGDTVGADARAFLARTGRPRLEKPIVPAELRRLARALASEAAR